MAKQRRNIFRILLKQSCSFETSQCSLPSSQNDNPACVILSRNERETAGDLFRPRQSDERPRRQSEWTRGLVRRSVSRALRVPSLSCAVSADWYVPGLARDSTMEWPRTIDDFGGFPRAFSNFSTVARASPSSRRRVDRSLVLRWHARRHSMGSRSSARGRCCVMSFPAGRYSGRAVQSSTRRTKQRGPLRARQETRFRFAMKACSSLAAATSSTTSTPTRGAVSRSSHSMGDTIRDRGSRADTREAITPRSSTTRRWARTLIYPLQHRNTTFRCSTSWRSKRTMMK